MTNILLIEDDTEIAELVSEALTARGSNVRHYPSGEAFFRAAADFVPDVIVLDIMLPGEDGLSICRRLRSPGSAYEKTPVIFLTALGELSDKVVGLEMGADDYLVKPFEMPELVARIKALVRRSARSEGASGNRAQAAGALLRFGPWRLDNNARNLIDENGVASALSSQEYRLLEYFLANPFRVLTREQILERIGSRAQIYDRTLDVQISRLRAKLHDNAKNPALIRTMRGDGYMLAVKVENV